MSQEVLRLRSENSPPSSLQARHIRNTLSNLEHQLNILKLLIGHIKRDRAQYKAILSPLRRVPMEVPCEIIAAAIPDAVLDFESRERVVELSLVSRRWRDAAHLCSRLWKGLFIGPRDKSVSKITTCLRRSGSLPKTVYFQGLRRHCPCQDAQPCDLNYPPLLKLLVDGPIIHHLAMYLDSMRCFKSFADLIALEIGAATPWASSSPHPWEALQSFSMYFISDKPEDWEEPMNPVESIVTKIPSVTSLQVDLPRRTQAFASIEESSYGPIHLTDIQLHRLSSFTIKWDWGNKRFFSVLRACVHVETLTIASNSAKS
ncbi:hypothetical protein DFP72DRAFT_1179007 [Ephemerocybe angulata]|uniref:F-box domain-containing protein n=1 Tax=Ephemerocybe angulata TaxID=980116 RepID=A0A8H6HAV9_9AGAR|nr:hypothetical protein DFP72DRAFT_1179007 [Tulosesus angulatus]